MILVPITAGSFGVAITTSNFGDNYGAISVAVDGVFEVDVDEIWVVD